MQKTIQVIEASEEAISKAQYEYRNLCALYAHKKETLEEALKNTFIEGHSIQWYLDQKLVKSN